MSKILLDVWILPGDLSFALVAGLELLNWRYCNAALSASKTLLEL